MILLPHLKSWPVQQFSKKLKKALKKYLREKKVLTIFRYLYWLKNQFPEEFILFQYFIFYLFSENYHKTGQVNIWWQLEKCCMKNCWTKKEKVKNKIINKFFSEVFPHRLRHVCSNAEMMFTSKQNYETLFFCL